MAKEETITITKAEYEALKYNKEELHMLQVKYNATVKQKNAEIKQLKKELTIINQKFNEVRR